MPATAGRVRMPANNRVHSSAALQTHGIWRSAIGYDPYAPVSSKKESKPDNDPENAYASFKGLLALARITSGGSNSDETRGACRKCGRIGHLTYQCRNFLCLKEDEKEGDDSALIRAANAAFEKIKKAKEETESEGDGDESESESSDSSVDPEIERIIAERFGKPMSKKAGSLKKRSNSSGDDDDEERKHKHERGRHRHRRKKRRDSDGDESDSDGNRKRRRRGKRRMSDSESSSDESDGHRGRRRSRRRKERRSVLSSDSESTASSSDEDERVKTREKRRRRRRRGHEREQRY